MCSNGCHELPTPKSKLNHKKQHHHKYRCMHKQLTQLSENKT